MCLEFVCGLIHFVNSLKYPLVIVSACLYLLCFDNECMAQTPHKTTALKRDDREPWLKLLKWPDGCEENFQRTYPDGISQDYSGLEFYHLGQGQYVIQITCYSGAYQPGSIFMFYNQAFPSSTRLLKFKGFDSDDDNGKSLPYSEIDGLSTFHKKTQVLEIFSKSRGLGDCGLFAKYKFVKGMPLLIEAREQDCDKEPSRRRLDPSRWPIKKL